ncbi:MAG TPA: hypothetical protein PLN61_00215 [bacterium]|nr:hypothetical protein [bacterium]HQI47064.1 hypothetical protein [bacterium]HQJ65379.1 hypothetical protein [bacterium]
MEKLHHAKREYERQQAFDARKRALLGAWITGETGWQFSYYGTFCKKAPYVIALGQYGWNYYCGRYQIGDDFLIFYWQNGAMDRVPYSIGYGTLAIDGVTHGREL